MKKIMMMGAVLAAGLIPLAWVVAPTCLDPTGAAHALQPAPTATTLTAGQALARLKAGNERFASDRLEHPPLGTARRRELALGQKPFAIVLTCADSRLAPEFIFNQGLGDLFVVREAGNIAEPFTEASMEYAVEHLHAPLIVVLGHTDCGAVKAALGSHKPGGNLGRLLAQIEVGNNLPPDPKAALARAIHHNVQHQTHLLTQGSEVLKKFVDEKHLQIVSGVYDLATGKVQWLDGQ